VSPAWQGEVMLLQWAESSTRGRTITLLLPEDDETHPFRDYGIKSGKRSGQRFMAVFVGLNDDETPTEPPLSTEAVMLCKDKDFWSWASNQSWQEIESEESAKRFLCEQLSIASRAELNSDERAAAAFRVLAAKYKANREFF
jgi:hypothetical protein